MARVQFSPLIVGASGKTGDVVWSKWKGINYIRSRVIPANPRTDDQTAQREALAHALDLWQSIKAWAKKPWDKYATGYAWSGYNRYMDDNIPRAKAATITTHTPVDVDYPGLIDPAIEGPDPTPGPVVCTWTARAEAAANNVVRAYYRLVATWEWTFSSEVAESVATLNITDLPTGEYAVQLVPSDTTPAELLWGASYGEIGNVVGV